MVVQKLKDGRLRDKGTGLILKDGNISDIKKILVPLKKIDFIFKSEKYPQNSKNEFNEIVKSLNDIGKGINTRTNLEGILMFLKALKRKASMLESGNSKIAINSIDGIIRVVSSIL